MQHNRTEPELFRIYPELTGRIPWICLGVKSTPLEKLDGFLQGISSAEVKEKLDRGDDFVMLDVRSPDELKMMRIEPCAHIPLGKLRNQLDELDKNREIVVYCKISLRGYEAELILKHAGFTKVKTMDGGILMWPYEKIVG